MNRLMSSRQTRLLCENRGNLDFDSAVQWIRGRDLHIVATCFQDYTMGHAVFNDRLDVETTPELILSHEAASLALQNKARAGFIQILLPQNRPDSFLEISEDIVQKLNEHEWRSAFFQGSDVFQSFSVLDRYKHSPKVDDEWLSTEEAVSMVVFANRGAMGQDKALNWLLAGAAKNTIVIDGAGDAVAYRMLGYHNDMHMFLLDADPAKWLKSSLTAVLDNTSIKGSRSPRGRKPKDIWPTIYIEATKWLAYESSHDEPMRQAELERWIGERLETHGEPTAESTIRDHAAFILKTFNNGGR